MAEWNKAKSNKNKKNILPAKTRKNIIPVIAKPASKGNANMSTNSKNSYLNSTLTEKKNPHKQEETDFDDLFRETLPDVGSSLEESISLKEQEEDMSQLRKELSVSSSSDEEASSASSDEESSRENEPLHEQIVEIGKKLRNMMSSNSSDEAEALNLLSALKEIPMSKDILSETKIGDTVNTFWRACTANEVRTQGRSLIITWRKILPESNIKDIKLDEDKDTKMYKKRPDRGSDSETEVTKITDNKKAKPEAMIADKQEVINPVANIPETNSVRMEEEIDNETVEEQKNSYVYIKGDHTDITRVNYFKITADLRELIKRTPEIIKSNKSLRITCTHEMEKRTLMETRALAGHSVTSSEPYTKSVYTPKRGIIFNVDDDLSTDEIEREIGISARRITKKVGGTVRPTSQVILNFNGDGDIPAYVYLGWRRFKVSTFIPEPTRCYNCQRYGHIAKNCNSGVICPICAKNHNYLNCPVKNNERNQESARCRNCGGPHPASYKGCSKYQLAKKVEVIKIKQGISYAEAVKSVINKESEKQGIGKHSESQARDIIDAVVDQQPTASEKVIEQNNRENNGCKNGNIIEETDSDPTNKRITQCHNSHNQCVDKITLVNLVQKIGVLLKDDLSKDSLIEKLYEILADLVKPIQIGR